MIRERKYYTFPQAIRLMLKGKKMANEWWGHCQKWIQIDDDDYHKKIIRRYCQNGYRLEKYDIGDEILMHGWYITTPADRGQTRERKKK